MEDDANDNNVGERGATAAVNRDNNVKSEEERIDNDNSGYED